jgi:hypothetical protein
MTDRRAGVTGYAEPITHALAATSEGDIALCSGEPAMSIPGGFAPTADRSCLLCREIINLQDSRLSRRGHAHTA